MLNTVGWFDSKARHMSHLSCTPLQKGKNKNKSNNEHNRHSNETRKGKSSRGKKVIYLKAKNIMSISIISNFLIYKKSN